MNSETIYESLCSIYENDELFVKTVDLAKKLHKHQKRANGDPYFTHVMRVAWRVSKLGLSYVIVALLHDSVEDGHIDFDELKKLGYHKDVIGAVKDLTRDKSKENYCQFVIKILNSQNPYSKIVKIADLEDNMADSQEGSRLDKYRLSHYLLTQSTDDKTRKMI